VLLETGYPSGTLMIFLCLLIPLWS